MLEDIKAFIRNSGAIRACLSRTRCGSRSRPSCRGRRWRTSSRRHPFETAAAHTYYLSPIPASWDDDQAASFLREYNAYALRSVGIHEAYPGHYVQLSAAQRHPRLLRRVLWNSAFAEGWAVYVERELIEGGYGEAVTDNADRMRLISAKLHLRSSRTHC